MRTIIHNIGQLVVVPPGQVRGIAMNAVERIDDAVVVCNEGSISWFGTKTHSPKLDFDETIDAKGGCVVPGLIDCHTHAVYAGNRADEFVLRIKGATYEQIMQAGGGIRSTMRAVRAASDEELLTQSKHRLERMLSCGTTTVEIKSGYGLSPEAELKVLRTVKALAKSSQVDIVATYLGAHAVPPEFEGRADDYLAAMVADDFLRTLREEGLAEFADVFCERGAFSVEQSRSYLEACKRFGMTPKVHAEQLSRIGATRMGIELDAISVDHLEHLHDEDIAALKNSSTIPVLLPGCNLFIGGEPAPARKMVEAGLPVALATDHNPGSCTIESLGVIMSLACTMLKMTPMEALVACTANAAAAVGREKIVGAIAVGHQADLLVLDIPRFELWAYRVGVNPVRQVLKRGQIVTRG
jgi:imidazolonepropionase